MITITLVHRLQNLPAPSWTFDREPLVRIGRSPDNDVVIYSAVVSRHHVELRQTDGKWQLVSTGTNGTYLDSQPITEADVVDGMVIRLASSGPQLKIEVGDRRHAGREKKTTGQPLSSAM